MATVLIPIPSRDFDPTEVAVSWKVLKRLGHSVVFATPAGREGRADDIMLTGEGLDLWGFLPGLRRLVAFVRSFRAAVEIIHEDFDKPRKVSIDDPHFAEIEASLTAR